MEESILSLPPINRHGFGEEDTGVKPYKIHVSSKYLELTKKKLELTRLPHDIGRQHDWEDGTPKDVIEPLIDFWLEHYSWRHQEAHLNSSLPQYRTLLTIPTKTPTPGSASPPLRIHFLHIRSPYTHAIPLLLIPSFPLTNLSLTPLFAPLTDPPHPTSTQPFHLVVPSIPGLGFSDRFTSPDVEKDALRHTVELFDALMKRVGYEYYVASGTGCGRESPAGIDYHLPRMIGEMFPESCLGVHLLDPVVNTPQFLGAPLLWLKWMIARFFHAGIWGYNQVDWQSIKGQEFKERNRNKLVKRRNEEEPLLPKVERSMSRSLHMLGLTQPNTFSYALCDSPVGLLSLVCSALKRKNPKHQLSNTEIIDVTQLLWLPGPECVMRFWSAAAKEVERDSTKSINLKSKVAITTFGIDGMGSDEYIPPAWAATKHRLLFVQRVKGGGGLTAWERTEIVVAGIRGLAKEVQMSDSRLKAKVVEEIAVSGDELISEENDREVNHGLQLDVESPDTVVALSVS
ncbi:Alpha/Beta hydrolase protein [Tricladium varicosporioides]|nr:Alpha/Beta hydrolase protein [Hymenoscyphus varicosporioides]